MNEQQKMTDGNYSKYSTMHVTLNAALLEKKQKYETTNKSNSTSS